LIAWSVSLFDRFFALSEAVALWNGSPRTDLPSSFDKEIDWIGSLVDVCLTDVVKKEDA
jgi:hypothetical protein